MEKVFTASLEWSESAKAGGPATIKDLEVVFARILQLVASAAGIACLVMLLIGGFKYLTAGDNPKSAESAKNTITYAFLGIFALIASWLILTFLEKFTGVTLTKFIIYTSE